MVHCINVNSKLLKSISKNLNIKPESLIGAIQEWQNDHNVDTFPSEQYLKRYYKLSGESSTLFSSMEDYKNALSLWERDFSKPKNYVNSKDAIESYNNAVNLFGESNVGIVPKNDSTFDIVVLKPSNSISNEFDVDLDSKLKEELNRLYPQIKLEYTNQSIKSAEGNVRLQKSNSLLAVQKLAKNLFFNEIYNLNLSAFNISTINSKLKKLSDSIGDSPWTLAISKNGNYYISGYNRQSVTSENYYSPNLSTHYQRNIEQKILGKADLEAMSILIDAINQKQDTLPHEYAHFYIAWYRNSPIVQTAIKKYGSEENLVQAIGENVVNQNGDINSWWNRFFNWIKIQFNKISEPDLQTLTNYLTDSFLQAKKLGIANTQESGQYFQSIDDIRKTFYNNKILKAKDREYLAKQAINLFSNIIDQLQGNGINISAQDASNFYFGDKYKDKDFTKMTRQLIIKTISPKGIFDQVRDKFFDPLEREDIEDESALDQLEVAYENFNELLNSAYYKLISAEHITLTGDNSAWVNDSDDEQSENLVGAIKDGEEGKEAYQKSFQNVSIKDSLSPLIKRALDKIRKRNPDGSFIKDKYGLIELVDSDTVYNTLLQAINKSLTIEQMEEVIKGMLNTNPWALDILSLISKEPFRSQFYQNFRKDFLTYSIVTRDIDEDGNYSYKTTIINTKNIETSILEEVTDALKNNELGLVTDVDPITGIGKINHSYVTGLKSFNDDILKAFGPNQILKTNDIALFVDTNLDKVSALLSGLGININDIALKGFLQKVSTRSTSFKRDDTNIYKMSSLIDSIISTIQGSTNYNKYELFGKGSDNVKGFYQSLSKLLSDVLSDSVESSTFENGKLYYAYVTPSYLGKLILNLKNTNKDSIEFSKFILDNYLQYGWFKNQDADGEVIYPLWIRELSEMNQKGDAARDLLSHKVQLHFNKTPYTDLSAIDYTLSLLLEFFSDFTEKPSYAWYHIPILADKPSAEFIKYKRFTDLNTANGYKDKIISELTNIAKLELRRIKTVLERAQIEKENITNFDIKLPSKLKEKLKSNKQLTVEELLSLKDSVAGGSRFKFLDFLNPILTNSTLEGHTDILNYLKGNAVDSTSINLVLKNMIQSSMEDKFNSALTTWQSIGLFDKNETVEGANKPYLYLNNLGNTEGDVKEQLRNYFYNSYLATANIIEMTVTDIAFYKDAEDFQKRYALIHSPGLRFNISAVDSNGIRYSSDGMETTMYLKDFEIASEIIPNIEKLLYEKVDANKLSKYLADEILAKFGKYDKIIDDLKFLTSKKGNKEVLIPTSEINVADALGYTSLYGYRKKLGMAGKWTPQMEEAYTRIKSGNWNLLDLNFVWQPLKPFVYSLIPKNSYAKTIGKLKTPVQNKNSEYLLLMTAAVIAGNKTNNKLKALNEFMEENEVDTIQFESAVKSGKLGVLDINNIDNVEDIKNILKHHLYEYDENGSIVKDNNSPKFNELYSHRIPFEDYGIQLEVPEHLTDASQLFGSLIRKLILADITPGTEFILGDKILNKQEFTTQYQLIIEANVQDSYNKLVEDLQLGNADEKERNKAISELLVNEIKTNARYGPELLRAVSLDDNGEFIVPLADPTHSYRIQQLFNSIIKSRLTKQKIKGGAVVQVSPYGITNDLNIVFNDDGSIKHFECYIPIPSDSWKDLLLDVDANGNSFYNIDKVNSRGEKVLSDDMRKLIGYRIPTEDKYSMAPLYIKGFLPEKAGSAIMLPKEITLLSGSDYDIDKMYVMLPEFEATPYYDRESFIDNLIKTLNKEPSKELKDSIRDVLLRGKKGLLDKDSNEDNIYKTWKKNKKLYADYNNGTIQKVEYDDSKDPLLNSVEARNNRLIDMIYSVLVNKDTASKIFNPGSFDVLKKTARIITILKGSKEYKYSDLTLLSLDELNTIIDKYGLKGKVTIIDPTTLVYFHQQNTIAGKLIGIFANHNTSHALLQLLNINFNLENDLSFDGISLSNILGDADIKLPAKLDSLYSLDGSTLITKNIAGFLAASVDAVKDPVLNFMNLNTFTANTAMCLARLGFDSDSIGLFLTLPIIETTTKSFFRKNNEKFVDGEVIIDEVINALAKLMGGNINIESIEKNLGSTPFTKEQLADFISQEDKTSLQALQFQLETLLLFKNIYKLGKELNTLTFITKFDTSSNAVGPTIADTLAKQLRVTKFMKNQFSEKAPFGPETYEVIENSPIIKAFYGLNMLASIDIFSKHFPHFLEDVTKLLTMINDRVKDSINSKTINNIINDFIAFKLTSGVTPVFSGSMADRKKYILDYPEKAKVDVLANKKYIDNDLIKVLSIKTPNKKIPVESLIARTGGMSPEALERIKNGWSDLATDEDTKLIATDLFNYNFYRSGFSFSPTSFMHAATIEVKHNKLGYIDNLRSNTDVNIFLNITDPYIEEFISQYQRNHSDNSSLVPHFSSDSLSIVHINNNSITINDNNSSEFKSLKTGTFLGEKIYAPTIVLESKEKDGSILESIWRNNSAGNTSPDYIKTTFLGIRGNAQEYSYNPEDVVESVIKVNNSDRKKGSKSFSKNEISPEDAIQYLNKDNLELANRIVQQITGLSLEEINKIIGKDSNKRSIAIKLLRALSPEYTNMENAKAKNLINYFEKITIKDAKGEKLC